MSKVACAALRILRPRASLSPTNLQHCCLQYENAASLALCASPAGHRTSSGHVWCQATQQSSSQHSTSCTASKSSHLLLLPHFLLLPQLFCVTGSDAHEEMRQACFDYLAKGGASSSGPVSLLSGLNPSPSMLVMHFFSVALFGVGRLLRPRPTFRCAAAALWLALWQRLHVVWPADLEQLQESSLCTPSFQYQRRVCATAAMSHS